jgi:hypothetical protein
MSTEVYAERHAIRKNQLPISLDRWLMGPRYVF